MLKSSDLSKGWGLLALILSPAVLMFVSANVANVGNLAFNITFSRLMTPREFADLTFVLTLMLGCLSVLGAVQMAVSRKVAGGDLALSDLGDLLRRRLWHIALFVVLAASLLLWLKLPIPRALAIIAFSIPFIGPLALLRGVALGRLNMMRTVLSAQVEMLVRLGLGVILWFLGFGLAGVAVALLASLIAAWVPLIGMRDQGDQGDQAVKNPFQVLWIASLPFAGLQLAQVGLLDGDILIGKTILSGEDAGLLAALGLVQRIQFFACFGLASVLLPSLIALQNKGESLWGAILPVALLYTAVTVPMLGLAIFLPETAFTLLVGEAYVAATPLLLTACVSAALFTLTYLLATFLLALGKSHVVWVLLAAMGVQLSVQALVPFLIPGSDLSLIVFSKLACQLALALVLLAYIWRSLAGPSVRSL